MCKIKNFYKTRLIFVKILKLNFKMKIVNKYRDVDVNEINLRVPEKQGGRYSSQITYKSGDFYMQTPSGLEISSDGKVNFTLVKKGEFFNALESITEKVADIISNNSEKFFKGKKFSREYIINAVNKVVDLDDNGQGFLNNSKISSECKVYDHLNELTTDSEFPLSGAVILHFRSVEFVKKNIKINVEIASIKTSLEKKKLDDCILEETEGNDEIKEVEETDEVKDSGNIENSQEQKTELEDISTFEPVQENNESELPVKNADTSPDLDTEVANSQDPLDQIIEESKENISCIANVTGEFILIEGEGDKIEEKTNEKLSLEISRVKSPESFFDDESVIPEDEVSAAIETEVTKPSEMNEALDEK